MEIWIYIKAMNKIENSKRARESRSVVAVVGIGLSEEMERDITMKFEEIWRMLDVLIIFIMGDGFLRV